MDIPHAPSAKLTSPDTAVSVIRSGARVFIGMACAAPRTLIRALESCPNALADVQLVHFISAGVIAPQADVPETQFRHRCFFVDSEVRELVREGLADYIPTSIAQVPWLVENGRIPIDVALIQTEAEHLCNVDYESEVAFLAVTGERENEQVVGSSCYFLNPSTNLAEVAYMIHPDWQSTGLGSALQRRMIECAKARGIAGFSAEVLVTNTKMLRLARGASDNVTSTG